LLYSGGYFCQVIEGPKTILGELFNIIQLDNRHKNVTMLHSVPIKSRFFENWAMAFSGVEGKPYLDIDGILVSKNELRIKEAGQNLLTILENLVKQHQNVTNSAS
jgi:hypothetical protein